eukprot:scaffold276_cov548-Prasinococcus_capsulatus_cf.AAC.19
MQTKRPRPLPPPLRTSLVRAGMCEFYFGGLGKECGADLVGHCLCVGCQSPPAYPRQAGL